MQFIFWSIIETKALCSKFWLELYLELEGFEIVITGAHGQESFNP